MMAYWLTFLSRITSSSSKTSFASLMRNTFPTANVICGIILLISADGGAILLSSAGRDIDPGIATRRWILRKRKHDVLPKYWTYFKPRATCLRDVRTHLGRLLVIMYSWLACPGLR